jgi:predicted MFS family arabinose efflux permease
MVGGIGAVLGPLFAVRFASRYRDVKIEIVSAFLFSGSVALLAISPWFELTLFLSAVATFVGTIFFSINLSAIQLGTPPELRGRVISVRFALSGTHPAGLMALGALAEVRGPQEALFAFSLGGILLMAVLNLALPARDSAQAKAKA